MPTLRELVTKLSFQTNLAPLEKVGKAVDGIRSRLDLLVGAEMVRAFSALSDKFGDFALDIRSAAMAAGLTTEEFQKLSYAAAQNGVSQDELGKALSGITKKLQEARLGSEEANLAFSRAGIAPEQIGSFKNAEQALGALGGTLNQIQDPILRASAAEALLGEKAGKLLSAMNAGSTGLFALKDSAEAANSVLSPGMINALIESEQAGVALKASLTTLTAQMVADLAPTITAVVKGLSRFISQAHAMLAVPWRKFIYAVGYAMGYAKGVIEDVSLMIIQTVRYLDDWGRRSGLWAAIQKGFELILKAGEVAFEGLKWVYDQFIASLVDVYTVTKNVAEGAADAWEKISKAIDWTRQKIDDFKAVIAKIDFSTIADALTVFSGVLGLLGGPQLAATVAGFSLLIGSIRTVIDLLHGVAFKDTWLGQMFEAAKDIPGQLANLFGFGRAANQSMQAQSIAQNVGSVVAMQQVTPSMMRTATPGMAQDPSARSQVTTNAPVTINVAGNADPQKLYDAVKDGVAMHHDKIMRQVQTAGAVSQVY